MTFSSNVPCCCSTSPADIPAGPHTFPFLSSTHCVSKTLQNGEPLHPKPGTRKRKPSWEGQGFPSVLECSSAPSQPCTLLDAIHGLLGQHWGQQTLLGTHWSVHHWILFFFSCLLASHLQAPPRLLVSGEAQVYSFPRGNLEHRSSHYFDTAPPYLWHLRNVIISPVKLRETFQERQESESIGVVYLQASTYVQTDVWSADSHTSLCWTLLRHTARNTLRNSANQCNSSNSKQLLLKSKTNSVKLTSPLCLFLYVQVMSGAGAYFLSFPLQILSGFKCRVSCWLVPPPPPFTSASYIFLPLLLLPVHSS